MVVLVMYILEMCHISVQGDVSALLYIQMVEQFSRYPRVNILHSLDVCIEM